jgi:hypothetical protein
MYYFCVGSKGAKLIMRHGLRISIALQAIAAAIWIIKNFLEIIWICKNVHFSQE